MPYIQRSPFKQKSEHPVIEKKLEPGVVAEANNDGTIFVSEDASPARQAYAVKEELKHQEDMKSGKRQEIQDLQIELETFQTKYFSQPNGEIYIYLQQRLAPIDALIQSAIEKVAAEKGYDYILDISQGIVVYKLDAYDLTQLVLSEVKRISVNKKDEE